MSINIDQSAQIQILPFFEFQNSIKDQIESSKKLIQSLIAQKKALYQEKVTSQKQNITTYETQLKEYKQKLQQQQATLKSKQGTAKIQQQLQSMIQYQQDENDKIEAIVDTSCNQNLTRITLQELLIKNQHHLDLVKDDKEEKEKILTNLQKITGVYLDYNQKEKLLEIQIEFPQSLQIQIRKTDKLKIINITPKSENHYQAIQQFDLDNDLGTLLVQLQQ